VRFAAALGLFVALATAVCPLRMCFADDEAAAPGPGRHGHEGHEGPDRNAGCCVDVPKETGGPWAVVQLDLPCVRVAELATGPRAPTPSAPAPAPRSDPLRSTVLLR
jgi:hypothetical protein